MASSTASTGSPKLDAAVTKVTAAAPQKLTGLALYSRFALAGAVCCSITHGALTPVDVYVLPVLPLRHFILQSRTRPDRDQNNC